MPADAPGLLALEDGTVCRGTLFGAVDAVTTDGTGGEVVFNTALTGYPEIISDPSYRGQIVMMTAPLIGNYGIADDDLEAARPWLSGFVCREVSPIASNFRATATLPEYLARNGIPAIEGIDTRLVTRRVREHGALRGVIISASVGADEAVARARAIAPMVGQDLASVVSCAEPYEWNEGLSDAPFALDAPPRPARTFRVVVVDTGVKRTILRGLHQVGFDCTVVPHATCADDILAREPHAVFFSNGPGDPAPVAPTIATARALIGRLPIFGICLGHQLLALALGARTVKMKFGHHGGNQPVKNLETGRVEITTQNHGFAVDGESLPDDCEITHVNLNDGSVEGFRHTTEPVFAVQYHPEAAPGPHDAYYLFGRFYDAVAAATVPTRAS